MNSSKGIAAYEGPLLPWPLSSLKNVGFSPACARATPTEPYTEYYGISDSARSLNVALRTVAVLEASVTSLCSSKYRPIVACLHVLKCLSIAHAIFQSSTFDDSSGRTQFLEIVVPSPVVHRLLEMFARQTA